MRTILFHIWPDLFGWPVFGFGWALVVWAVAGGLYLGYLASRPDRKQEIPGLLPVLAILGLAIAFVLPRIEEHDLVTGERLGLPIRGYGLMLLLAVSAGVMAAVRRARQAKIDPEVILSLAFFLFVAGLIGARAFFVWHHWGEILAPTAIATLQNIVNITNGGLVVYGAFLTAVPVAIWFIRAHRLPLLLTADVASAAMLIGLSIGRLGCLMHGCCFGGICELPWSVTFPVGSPPYDYQQSLGVMHGFRIVNNEEGQALVAWVDEAGPAAAAGLRLGDKVSAIDGQAVVEAKGARSMLRMAARKISITTHDGRTLAWEADVFPARTPLRMHPAQVYASISAGLLALVLWFYFPFRRRSGEVFALMLILYPVARFLEEVIRDDEGSYAAGLTFSQTISLGLFACGIGLMVWLAAQPGERETAAKA